MKRTSPLVTDCDVDPKKFKHDPEKTVAAITEDDDNATLAPPHCPGIEVNNVSDQVAEGNELGHRVALSVRNEKELRRKRGEMLMRLFKEHPLLAGLTATRKADKNAERAQMWKHLTQQKVKKLVSYYKKRDDVFCNNNKTSGKTAVRTKEEDSVLECTIPPSECDSTSTEHGGFELYNITPAAVVNESDTEQQRIYGSSSRLIKERNEFVVSLVEYYMERMCFDSSSRTARVNAERHNMWLKILRLTNKKYSGLLSPLYLEQAKKLFSNCKRRRHLCLEKRDGDSQVLPPLTPSVSSSSDGNSVGHNGGYSLASLLKSNGIEQRRDDEIIGLRRQLADRDAEVEKLRRKIIEQEDECEKRINCVISAVKTATEKFFRDLKTIVST